MTAEELSAAGRELGLDVVGAAPAEPYEDTERHIGDRHGSGLFGDDALLMAQPEVSCHPETLSRGRRARCLRRALLLT